MIGCLRTRVRNQPIIALYFESENVLKLYNLEARPRTQWRCWHKALRSWLVPDSCLRLGPSWLNLRFSLARTICESWTLFFVLSYIYWCVNLFRLFYLRWYIASVSKHSCKLNNFCVLTRTESKHRYGTIGMHLSSVSSPHPIPVAKAVVRSKAVALLSMIVYVCTILKCGRQA